ncbi:LCP family protein [Dehalobacter sp. TBBPA1]|uniref:LCP family protein n=1 Tax=Dehalobacter sp. TBBPA1 TaxID=3235037 RepID=UPI0034A32224
MIKNNKKIIIVVSCLILLVLITGLAYYLITSLDYNKTLLNTPKNSGSNNSELESTAEVSDIGTDKVIYILFLGIDKTEEREEWLGVYRSDTIMIGKVDITNKKIQLLSIPRDTYTYIPIEGKFDKINHAYAYGSVKGDGVSASIDAVSHLLGKNVINYYFLMNMEPIPNIVDEIGGVKVDVEIDMKDHGANLSKGVQILNGRQAFDYIHWRYSPGGDIDRIQRQQKFLNALYKQQRDSGEILETLNIILKYKNEMKTDLTLKQMIALTKLLSEIPGENVEQTFIPGKGQMINNISYWVPDQKKTEKILSEFIE